MSEHLSKRLVAGRVRRVWAVAEEIAANPGQSRGELARRFFVSERQVQADLNIIRTDMRLPLVRRLGYRYADEGGSVQGTGPLALTLRDALLLVSCLAQTRRPAAEVRTLADKLILTWPLHLRPLLRLLTGEATAHARTVALPIAAAMLDRRAVRLHYPAGSGAQFHDAVMQPELLVPYLGGWYAIGAVTGDRCRNRMVRIDGLAAVTPAAWDGDER